MQPLDSSPLLFALGYEVSFAFVPIAGLLCMPFFPQLEFFPTKYAAACTPKKFRKGSRCVDNMKGESRQATIPTWDGNRPLAGQPDHPRMEARAMFA